MCVSVHYHSSHLLVNPHTPLIHPIDFTLHTKFWYIQLWPHFYFNHYSSFPSSSTLSPSHHHQWQHSGHLKRWFRHYTKAPGWIFGLILSIYSISHSLITPCFIQSLFLLPANTLTAAEGFNGVIWEHTLTTMRVVNSLLAEDSYRSCIHSLVCFPLISRDLPKHWRVCRYFNFVLAYFIS